MPLFRRPDGDLVKDESPIRRILPHLLKTRNQSAIYHESIYDLTRTLEWLDRFNASDRRRSATLFHLLMYACGRAIMEYPQLNRFVSGNHIYEHRDVNLTFAAKQKMTPESPVAMVKVPLTPDDTFGDFVDRTRGGIQKGRETSGDHRPDKLDILLHFPSTVVAAAVGLWRLADRWNLLPASWLEDDPMYTSICFTNLGSVGLNDVYHHLSEYGTASLFASMGKKQRTVFVGRNGEPEVKEGLQVRWSADERIADGLYTARVLQRVCEFMEDPEAQGIAAPAQEVSASADGERVQPQGDQRGPSHEQELGR